MVLCRFYRAGNCKFGNYCKNEHPRDGGSTVNNNGFAPLQNSTSGSVGSRSNRGPGANRDNPYKLDKATIINDLSKERPQWILSAYGAGREAPIQLFGGVPREQSFEELRFHHYELAVQGRQQEAIQEAQNLVNNAEQQIQATLNDVDGAIKYVINGEHDHPNRIDIVNAKGTQPAQIQITGQTQQPTLAFGQSSTATSAFRQSPAFSRPQVPTFGQPSSHTSLLGQGASSAFGQPSALGQSAALGRPATSFGQPSSTFGNPSVPPSTFGQPSAPSPFGAPQQRLSPFGSLPGQNSTIQPSSTANPSSNPFSLPSGPAQQGSFGQPSTSAQSSIFGKPAASNLANPFTQNTAAATTAPVTSSGPFSQSTAPPSQGSFGQSSAAAPASTSQSSKTQFSFANRPVPSFGFSLEPLQLSRHSSNSANITEAQPVNISTSNGVAPRGTSAQGSSGAPAMQDPTAKISNWKGKPVSYIDDEPCFKGRDGSWQRIWFPHGPPVFTKTPELLEEAYSVSTRDDYRFAKEYGVFKDGMMPELPPRREWCNWDF